MYICSRRDYDFHSLSANARSHTRRGLARCIIERIGFDRLARDGFGLIEDTTLRQTGGRPSTTPAQWGRFCAIAARTPDVEAWGAIAEDKLAAFIVGMLIGDCFYLHLQKSSSALLKHYPNNALMFELTRMKLAAGAAQVSHGQIALAASAGLDTFKRSMGFEVRPFKERVAFNPLLKRTLWLGRGIAGRLGRRYPENLFLRRVSKSLDLASRN
jgi:hypothetical protein